MKRRSDAGLATVETAMALPALCLVVVTLGCILAALTQQLRCIDAARAGARAAARGEPIDVVEQRATLTAPRNATVSTTQADGFRRVTVRLRLGFPGLSRLPSMVLSATAVARDEAVDEPAEPAGDVSVADAGEAFP